MQSKEEKLLSRRVSRKFKGKTIKRVDTTACNMWIFYFTDGTEAAIETEAVGHGLYGFALVPNSDLDSYNG